MVRLAEAGQSTTDVTPRQWGAAVAKVSASSPPPTCRVQGGGGCHHHLEPPDSQEIPAELVVGAIWLAGWLTDILENFNCWPGLLYVLLS